MKIEYPVYLGKMLLGEGFRVWFLYMFRVIEDKPFIEESLHDGLFSVFNDIYNQVIKRLNINVPPRSGKTTMAIYFIAFCLAKNSKCNFIYTSFSQSLLSDISRILASILEHPVYKAMYGSSSKYEELEENPINDFWRDYLEKETGRATYSSRKITTESGGVVLFASIGSAITGFGAGIRGSKYFSGALLIDDPNKPADIRSELMREKVLSYYEETLLSRLNQSTIPIINIQQRLHLEDLSGFLISMYDFHTLKRALLVDGICQLPSQYDDDRLHELQINKYMFEAQYQQEPFKLGGSIIKSEWFNYYQNVNTIKFKRLFFTADTAQKTKEHNDYTVFCAWGIDDANLYLIDMVRGKWEAPQLLVEAKKLWDRYKVTNYNGKRFGAMYVEDKSSGTGLIQTLKLQTRIPVMAIQRHVDKLTRAEDILPTIESGRVYLPFDKIHGFNPVFLSECEGFTRDNSHKHDDIVDNLIDACYIYGKGYTQGDLL